MPGPVQELNQNQDTLLELRTSEIKKKKNCREKMFKETD